MSHEAMTSGGLVVTWTCTCIPSLFCYTCDETSPVEVTACLWVTVKFLIRFQCLLKSSYAAQLFMQWYCSCIICKDCSLSQTPALTKVGLCGTTVHEAVLLLYNLLRRQPIAGMRLICKLLGQSQRCHSKVPVPWT
eukprot:jgi/Botrbrau1/631/Bobra.0161s0022.1